MRHTIDMTALGRSTIGFERLLDLLEDSEHADLGDGYPPYNIERTSEDQYRIVLALAGFGEADLTVTQESNLLTIAGAKAREADTAGTFLYRGIAARTFTRRFDLADFVYVRGAKLANGLLTIDLERQLPEAMKPRRIAIETVAQKEAGKRAA